MNSIRSEPITFYDFLISVTRYNDSEARQLIGRYNSFKEKAQDRYAIKKYSEYIKSFTTIK